MSTPAPSLATIIAAYQDGRLADAARDIAAVLAREPDNAPALNLSAGIAQREDRLEDASAALERAVLLAPNVAEYRDNLAQVLRFRARRGAVAEALAAWRHVAEALPDDPTPHVEAGVILEADGRHRDARDSFGAALRLQPDKPELWLIHGNQSRRMGAVESAKEAYRKGLEVAPDDLALNLAMGLLLLRAEQDDAGWECFDRALTAGADASLLFDTAMRLETSNRPDAAEQLATRALALFPGDQQPRLAKTIATARMDPGPDALETAEALLAGTSELPVARMLASEIGLMRDRMGDHAAAFRAFAKANAATKAVWPEHAEQARRFIDYARQVADALRRRPYGPVSPSDAATVMSPPSPVFQIGFPRSGTTLLQQVLAGHPALQPLEEENVMARLAERPPGPPAEDRAAYFDRVDQVMERDPTRTLLDKMPLNTVFLPRIHGIFPDARILFVARHPCDVCLSCYMQSFEPNPAMAAFLDLETTAELYDAVMALWIEARPRLFPHGHIVRYEDLTGDFETTVRALLKALDLPWVDGLEDIAARSRGRSVNTPSYRQVSRDLLHRPRGRWHDYTKELGPILSVLRPWIAHFGYEDP